MNENQKGFGMAEGLIILVIACLLGFVGWFFWQQSNNESGQSINSFEACAAAGNPIMQSYPEQCSANGKTFTNPAQTPQKPPVTE